MFIYKSKPRFYIFHDHSRPHIELQTRSLVLKQSFQAVWDYLKMILILTLPL